MIPRPSKSKDHKLNNANSISTPDFNMITLNVPSTTKNGDLQRSLQRIPGETQSSTINFKADNYLTHRPDDKISRRTAQTLLAGLTRS